MFCISCGTQLPDEAGFCWKCGKPQKQSLQAHEPKWETCEILYEQVSESLWGASSGYFHAKAIGPQGVYAAGKTPIFGCGYNTGSPDASNQKTVLIHSTLISYLAQDGWESTGDRGTNWWNHRFRRQARLDTGEKTTTQFDVVLLAAGKRYIEVIKVICQLTNVGLGEAKGLAETPNAVVLRNVSKEDAQYAKLALEKAGGTVRLR